MDTKSGKIRLGLIGQTVGPRYSILVNSKQVLLTQTSFRYLVGLVVGRILNVRNGGYISKYNIDDVSESHGRYFYRMAHEISSGMGGRMAGWWPIYESDKIGNYRLRGDVTFDFNWEHLEVFPDKDVLDMVARIKAKKGVG